MEHKFNLSFLEKSMTDLASEIIDEQKGIKKKKEKIEEPNFEFYVLNYDANARKVIHFNIFRNILLYEETLKGVKAYVEGKITYKEFKLELMKDIHWQEWGRREYEISVADAFETDVSKLEKWCCAEQADPNIEWIADMCIKRYKEWAESGSTGK